jgi:hypothetical protein
VEWRLLERKPHFSSFLRVNFDTFAWQLPVDASRLDDGARFHLFTPPEEISMATSKLMTIAALILIGGATGYSAPAPCQPLQAAGSDNASAIPSFEQLDTKHRGYLVRSDIPKNVEPLMALRMHFTDYDRNGNGRLDNTEYAGYVATLAPNNQSGGAAENRSQPMH